MRFLVSFIIGFCLLCSCVGKKKYVALIAEKAQTVEDFNNQLALKELDIYALEQAKDSLAILYAEQRGANNVLLITQDKLQDRIDEVQNQVAQEKQSKNSTTQDLQSVVEEKDAAIADRDNKLAELLGIIEQHNAAKNQMVTDFSAKLEAYGVDNYAIKIIGGELRVSLKDELLFRPDQSRVKTDGVTNLGIIAGLINEHPSIRVDVVSNTDNTNPKGFKDNLELSAIRAAGVVRVLTDDYGVSPSRVLAGGKGDSAPKASNETPAGRLENQRVDFIISSRMDRVVRDLEKLLKEEK